MTWWEERAAENISQHVQNYSFIASPLSQDLSFDQCGFAVTVLWVVCCLLSPATVYAHVTRCGCKVGACSRWFVYPLLGPSGCVGCPAASELGGHDPMEVGLG